MDISVVICTWNDSQHLTTTLQYLTLCSIPKDLKWELVLVNNISNDDTASVVECFQEKLPLIYLREERLGLSLARNRGIAASKGELILFTDSDVKPSMEWIVSYWAAYQKHPSGYFFGGSVESEFEGIIPEQILLKFAPPSVRGLEFGLVSGPMDFKKGGHFISANWACPRRDLIKTGGFDETRGLNPLCRQQRTGEETDLMCRLIENGMRAWYVSDARIVHMVPSSHCTLQHIAERLEAYSVFCTEKHIKSTTHNINIKTILGVPYANIKYALFSWLRWQCARVLDRDKYEAYTELRKAIGSIKCYRSFRGPL